MHALNQIDLIHICRCLWCDTRLGGWRCGGGVVSMVESDSGGRPRLQWRHLTHPHLELDGQLRPPWPRRSSLFHLRMTDAPLSVKCQ